MTPADGVSSAAASFGMMFNRSPSVVAVPAASGIRAPRALAGRHLRGHATDVASRTFPALAARIGVHAKTVRISASEEGMGAVVAGMLNGDTDGIFGYESTITAALITAKIPGDGVRGVADTIADPTAAIAAGRKRTPAIVEAAERARLELTLHGEMGHPESGRLGIGAIDASRFGAGVRLLCASRALARVAVHLQEAGTDVRTIQTAARASQSRHHGPYLRIATTRVCSTSSPLDLLPHRVPPASTPVASLWSGASVDRPTLNVADVFRRHRDAYRGHANPALSRAHQRVMRAIETGRTAALGGHVEQCDGCGHTRIWYITCRNRHCPTCQSLARAAWIEDRTADVLDCEYVHVVFTVPQAIAEIAAQNKSVVYGLLFRTTAETLRTIAADPKHLGAGAEIGFFAVLHTWGQTRSIVHAPGRSGGRSRVP